MFSLQIFSDEMLLLALLSGWALSQCHPLVLPQAWAGTLLAAVPRHSLWIFAGKNPQCLSGLQSCCPRNMLAANSIQMTGCLH